MGTINQDAISWVYYDGLGPWIQDEAHSLASHLTHGLAFDKFSLDFHMHYQQNEPFTCGTIALLHLQQALGRTDQLQPSDILNLHFQLLQSRTTRPLFFGLGPSISEMTQQLITILESKGVPADQSQSRAQQVLERIGPISTQKALSSRAPWAELKAAASMPKIMLRLVLPSELSAHVNHKADIKFGADTTISAKKKLRKSRQLRPHRSTLTALNYMKACSSMTRAPLFRTSSGTMLSPTTGASPSAVPHRLTLSSINTTT